uniref:Ribosome assembly factor mrt4 n=1 Tax=Lygus hesperus TaxID=30085 RepID=A0A0A9YT94_LYGHE
MPKSKRDKKVSLTKTTKKGLQAKQALVEEIRKCAGNYENIFVFSVENMRNSQLKDLRNEWSSSRFFFGKNKVMSLGLGRKREEEIDENVHQISSKLKGQCGLLFTNEPCDKVIDYFKIYEDTDFARSGFVATETVTLPAAPLPDFPHSMEPQLRQLGLPTSLQRGIITLLTEHTVCKEGDTLTPEQARILKLLGRKMANFRVTLICSWSKGGIFTPLIGPKAGEGSAKKPKKNKKKKSILEEKDTTMEVES